ncbi:MAG: glutathione-dependent disulfide-bond oxidoreductase [Zetaproteobacteria bacterium]|nr:glutathione-dependent disulfide-bond oxidoreductase [Zetaproteobacteria bacterium]
MTTSYVPPKVWQNPEVQEGAFAQINQPTAGARVEQELPRGNHPLQLYSMGTPNGVKVTVLLEELLELGVAEAEYDAFLINILEGEQFGSGFVDINPNSKIPALVDYSCDTPQTIFESASILVYLAEKFSRFLPTQISARTQTFNWLFWLQGSAPFVGGGFGHFYRYAPEKIEYPINRFSMETKRQLDVLNRHFARSEFVIGSEYTIADMAILPWHGAIVLGDLYEAGEFLSVEEYPHLRRWATQLRQRKAVRRGYVVNVFWGNEDKQLKERHHASDFKQLKI